MQTSDSTKDSIEIKLPEAGERLEAIGVREQPLTTHHLPLTPYAALRAFRRVGCASKFGGLRTPAVLVPPSGLNPNSRIFCKIHYRAGSLREIHYVRARRPTLLLLWAIRMPGRCGYWFASLLALSPEGWYILCRGRRPRLQVQSKIREARRADTQDLLRHSWSFPRVMCQPSGLCA